MSRTKIAAVCTAFVLAGGGITAAQAASPAPAPAATPTAAGAARTTARPASADAPMVVLDTDMGELNDDAQALFLLARHRQVDLLGVVTVSGNTWTEAGTAYALSQLQLIGRSDIPVVEGAALPLMPDREQRLVGDDALYGTAPWTGAFEGPRPSSYRTLPQPPYGGYAAAAPLADTSGADFIVHQVEAHPHQVTLLEIGPLTNLAIAVSDHPEIVPLIKQVVYMGGAFTAPGNIGPAAEFNFWFDPEAAKIVLRQPFAKQTIVPNELCTQVVYSKPLYQRVVAGAPNPVKREFEALQGPTFAKDPGYTTPVWDSIAAAVLLDPSLVTRQQVSYVDVDDVDGPDYGRAIAYDLDEYSPPNNPVGTQRATIVQSIDIPRFWNEYVAGIAN